MQEENKTENSELLWIKRMLASLDKPSKTETKDDDQVALSDEELSLSLDDIDGDAPEGDFTEPTGLIRELTKKLDQVRVRLEKRHAELLQDVIKLEEDIEKANSSVVKSGLTKVWEEALDKMISIENMLDLTDAELAKAGLYLGARRLIAKHQKELSALYKQVNAKLKENPDAYEMVKNLKNLHITEEMARTIIGEDLTSD